MSKLSIQSVLGCGDKPTGGTKRGSVLAPPRMTTTGESAIHPTMARRTAQLWAASYKSLPATRKWPASLRGIQALPLPHEAAEAHESDFSFPQGRFIWEDQNE